MKDHNQRQTKGRYTIQSNRIPQHTPPKFHPNIYSDMHSNDDVSDCCWPTASLSLSYLINCTTYGMTTDTKTYTYRDTTYARGRRGMVTWDSRRPAPLRTLETNSHTQRRAEHKKYYNLNTPNKGCSLALCSRCATETVTALRFTYDSPGTSVTEVPYCFALIRK